MHTVDSAFEKLKRLKITTSKESVRRWLRDGTIKGIQPRSKKIGWTITEESLNQFIADRLPETEPKETSINVESAREEMWWQLVRKFIFEGEVQIKKSRVKECVDHNKHTKEFFTYAWNEINKNKNRTPRVYYLLDHCLFDGRRIAFKKEYEGLEEQIIFAVIEHLRLKRVGGI